MTLQCTGCGTPPGVKVDPVTFAPHCIKCNSIITINLPAGAPAQQQPYVIYNIPSAPWPVQNIQLTSTTNHQSVILPGSLGAGIDSLTPPEKQETPEEAYDRAMGVIK